MRAILTGLLLTVLVSVGAFFASDALRMSSQDAFSSTSNSVRLGDDMPARSTDQKAAENE